MTLFARSLENYGNRIALISATGEQLSYGDLAARADSVAATMPAQRCLVALEMRADLDSVVRYIAALRAAYPVILLGEAGPTTERIHALYQPWVFGAPPPTAQPELHPDLAVLLSTSGTTGSPKLVRLSAANIDANARSIASYLGIDPAARAITSLPLHYSYGLSVLNSHLAAGASIVLTETPVNQEAFWDLFAAQQVTSIAGVPFSYELFERIGLRDRALPSLKAMTQAGGRLPPTLVTRYAEWAASRGIRFFVMYGATEATARMAYLPPELALQHSNCIGVAIPGGTLRIEAAPDDEPGAPGELVYTGPNVMMGYAETPDELARGMDLTELRTGDLAEVTSDGLFRIVGRRSRFSKLFGLRISHDTVEQELAVAGISAIVTGNDHALVIFTAAAGDIVARLAARYGLPQDSFVVVEGAQAPRLPSGKPDFGAIQRTADAEIAKREAAAAARATADPIGAIFAANFPGHRAAPQDSFISLGGDSLSYVTFSIALEDALGFAPTGWEERTLAELRAMLGQPVSTSTWSSLESDIPVRAAAICGVVALHTGLGQGGGGVEMAGGSPLLMILFGYNIARFQRGKLLGTGRIDVLKAFFLRIMLPYLVILTVYGLAKHELSLPSLLLVSNYFGRFGSALEPYWFMEASLQCLLALVLLLGIPPLRQFAQGQPARFAIVLLLGALGLKIIGNGVLDQHYLQQRTLDATFVYVTLGWAVWSLRDTRQRIGLLLFALALSGWSWGWVDSHLAWMAAGMAVLLFVPRIPMPAWLARLVVWIAAASFYIYLTHIFVIHLIEINLHINLPLLTQVTAVAVGISCWAVLQRIDAYRARRSNL